MDPGETVQQAVNSVKPHARGLTVDEVTTRLTQALRERDAFLPPDDIRFLARALADPRWPLKHPAAALGEFLRGFRARKQPSPESARFEAETAHLQSRLDEVPQIARWRSRRTVDGIEHEVVINPWTDEVAARIQRLAAPIRVNVIGEGASGPGTQGPTH